MYSVLFTADDLIITFFLFQSSVDESDSHFIAYEQIQEQVEHILQHWDLAQGLLLLPLASEETLPVSEDAPAEKQVR